MANKIPLRWSDVRPALEHMSHEQLYGLVRELFERSTDNRAYLAARLMSDLDGGATFEYYRRQITDQFFPARGLGRLRLREARKAIRDYRAATGDLAGTIDLMLTYVESGTQFTLTYGDIDEPFYNSLESVLNEMVELLLTPEGMPLYAAIAGRCYKLRREAPNIGWGYGDALDEQLGRLERASEERSGF
jgi:hypothetical protein